MAASARAPSSDGGGGAATERGVLRVGGGRVCKGGRVGEGGGAAGGDAEGRGGAGQVRGLDSVVAAFGGGSVGGLSQSEICFVVVEMWTAVLAL